MRRLCADIALRLPEFRHIDISRVGIRFCQTRKAVQHGTQASLTPLRFEGGASTTVRDGVSWTIERRRDLAGKEYLYLLSFYLPRFQNLPYLEKLTTVFHELWHIGPNFDGDLRRNPGRCYAHGGSRGDYDSHMRDLADRWLDLRPPHACHDFLKYDFAKLQSIYGGIVGTTMTTPKMRRVE